MRTTARSTSRDHHPTPKRITKHQQIAMLTTLQRCSQLHRDDKAQLRRRIREFDEEIIAVFTRHRRPINYQMLQADLRKLAVKNMNTHGNKENVRGSCESERRPGSVTYRLQKKKSNSGGRGNQRKESLGSNNSRKTVVSVKKTELLSPKNSWFSRLQHKLKFKNQVKQECTPVDSTQPTSITVRPVTPSSKHCQIQQQLNVHRKPNLSTKNIKERILDRQKYRLDNVYLKEQPKVSLPTPQQSLMFSFKNDLRLSLHQSNRDQFVQNISSLDVSPGRQSYSLNDTQRKLINQMQLRKSIPKTTNQPRSSIDPSTIFRSQYQIPLYKIDLLKQLTIFKHRYAQDLLLYFFQSPRKLLSRQDFFQQMIKLLQEMDVSVRSFETMEQFVGLIIGEEAFITPVMLGNALEVVAQHKQSQVRVVYEFLNCHKRKVLTIEDMLEYIEGGLKSKQAIARAEYLCYELLYLCSKDGRLSYWDLYLARESPQFVELCNLLTS